MKSRKQLAIKSPKPIDPDKVQQVFRWIIAGGTKRDIEDAIAKQFPNDDPMPLILAVMENLHEAGQFDAQTIQGWCFEAYRDLYRRMVEVGDYTGATRAVKLIAELSGV